MILSEPEIRSMKVAELRQALRERQLPVGGVKKALIERLLNAMMTAELQEEQQHEEETAKDSGDDGVDSSRSQEKEDSNHEHTNNDFDLPPNADASNNELTNETTKGCAGADNNATDICQIDDCSSQNDEANDDNVTTKVSSQENDCASSCCSENAISDTTIYANIQEKDDICLETLNESCNNDVLEEEEEEEEATTITTNASPQSTNYEVCSEEKSTNVSCAIVEKKNDNKDDDLAMDKESNDNSLATGADADVDTTIEEKDTETTMEKELNTGADTDSTIVEKDTKTLDKKVNEDLNNNDEVKDDDGPKTHLPPSKKHSGIPKPSFSKRTISSISSATFASRKDQSGIPRAPKRFTGITKSKANPATPIILGNRTNSNNISKSSHHRTDHRTTTNKPPATTKTVTKATTTTGHHHKARGVQGQGHTHWTQRPPAPLDPQIKYRGKERFQWCRKCSVWNTTHGTSQHSYFCTKSKTSNCTHPYKSANAHKPATVKQQQQQAGKENAV